MDPTKAATKIQAGFRGMRDRKKVKAEMDSLTREGKVLAEIPEAMAWKMVGKEHAYVATGTVRVIRVTEGGKAVVFISFDTGEAGADDEPDEVLEVFPLPLSTQIPVTKHSGVFYVFPTVAYSSGVFVGIKISKRADDYEKFVAALEVSSGVEDSESLQKARERASKVQQVAQTGAQAIRFTGRKIGEGVHAFGGFVNKHLAKKETDTKISESTKEKVKLAQAGAASAVQMSGMAVNMMAVMTQSMATAMVEGVESTEFYKNYQTKGAKKQPPSAAVQQAKVIAGEVILGYSALVDAMFEAGEHVLDETIDTTAEVIEHRHGSEAGETAKAAGVAAKDGVKAGLNVVKIGPKGVVKGAATAAGKELVADSV
eukprot:m.260073 g.260073  ORF g.260073 m.260073 type:complete len:371 (-) comp15983_c0_seq4:9574-10686(-)